MTELALAPSSDWTREAFAGLFDLPLPDLLLQALEVPTSWIRLSAGREQMSEEAQALCLTAGANSIFVGSKLLTTANPDANKDEHLMETLGLDWGPRSDKPQAQA